MNFSLVTLLIYKVLKRLFMFSLLSAGLVTLLIYKVLKLYNMMKYPEAA